MQPSRHRVFVCDRRGWCAGILTDRILSAIELDLFTQPCIAMRVSDAEVLDRP